MSPGEDRRIDDLVERLAAIADELADLAVAELTQAVGRREQSRPATERAITQARRAVDKATHILRRTADPSAPEGSDEFD